MKSYEEVRCGRPHSIAAGGCEARAEAPRYLAAAVVAALLGALTACSRPESAAKGSAVAAKPAERYAMRGEVISLDAARKVLVVKHEEIKGYMPAMTMEFAVDARDLNATKPGQRIRAEMIPSKDGDFRLEKIWPDEAAAAATVAAAANALRQDTHTRGKNAYREIGEAMPDFALYDQEARVVPSGRFRGKQIMLNFIFTRCPVATMCPASTAKMMLTQKGARDAGVPNIEFVSITLDPAYDTPAVLKEYAQTRGIDTQNFSFLTGPDNAIKDLLAQFGVIAELEGELIKHTLATLLIAENGQISHRADGSAWEPKDFVAKMKK
ncbi:MAG: SCO family protein [Verrucomicrobia bacterium]|nr:SCO family protein [Verrucomicrobiota bacterium]